MPQLTGMTFAGDPGGPMPKAPVTDPGQHDDGTQNIPIGDAAGDTYAAQHGLVAAPGGVNLNDRRTLPSVSSGPPPVPEAAPNREAHHIVTGLIRQWGEGEWDQWNPGSHGEVTGTAATPPGIAMPAVPARGNTFRLQPQPWDSPLFFAQQGAEASPEPRGPGRGWSFGRGG